MEDDVGPERQRTLDRRRGERVVDDDEWPDVARLRGALADRLGNGGDVDDLEVRVRRRFEPDETRARRQFLPECVGARGEVRVVGIDTARSVDSLEVAERSAVDVVTDHDLVA